MVERMSSGIWQMHLLLAVRSERYLTLSFKALSCYKVGLFCSDVVMMSNVCKVSWYSAWAIIHTP